VRIASTARSYKESARFPKHKRSTQPTGNKIQKTHTPKRRRTLEKIRELISLLESGVEDYDTQLKVLQAERLKYIRLSMTDGFGTEEGDSKESWLLHLKQLEDSLTLRRDSIRQAIQQTAEDIQKEENA